MNSALCESIVEESDRGIIVVKDGDIVSTNGRLQELLGYSKSELLSATPSLLSQDGEPSPFDSVEGTDETGLQSDTEADLVTSTGERIPVHVSVSNVQYQGGSAVVGFVSRRTPNRECDRDLQDLQREYETVFEHVQDGLFLLDVDDDGTIRFQRFNGREEAFTGLSTEEVRGRTPVEVFGDELGAEIEANYRECIKCKETITYEEELPLGGETGIWQTKLTPIVVDGEVDRIVGSGREITALREREQKLERRTDLFEQAQEIADLGAWETDLQSNEGWWTEEVNRIYGLPLEYEPSPGEGIEYFHPDDRPTIRAAFKRAIEDGESYDLELRVVADDGPTKWVQTRGIPYYEDGTVVGVRGTIQEITERKEREQELERARGRLRVLFDQAPDALVIHDEAGRILDTNEQHVDNLGYEYGKLLSMRVTDFEVGPDDEALRDHWAEMDVGETLKTEGEHERKDGSSFPVEVWVSKTEVHGEPRFVALSRDITERRERERRIRGLKERLELAVEGAEIGVWDWDMTTDAVEFNTQWAEMLGYSPEEIEPHLDAWKARVHPDDLGPVEDALDAHIAGEADYYDTEHRMRTAAGDWRWIRDVGKIVERDEEGEPVRAVGIHIDIEERKQRERKLRQFREAVEQTAHAVYITDTDGTIEYVNPAFAELTGYEEREALGQTPRILKSGEHDDEFYETFWETITAGQQWEDEVIDERSDGEQIVIHQTVSPITDGSGDPKKFVVVAQDVTQRKEYEEALERAQAELREIIDLVPDLIFMKNREGEYLLANEATAEAYGSTPEEIEGKLESQVIPDAGTSRTSQADALAVIETGEPTFTSEEELTTADGETRILQTTKIPYEVAASGEKAVLGYARDVTELKEYEQQLETQRDNLELLNQVVRHDIRNDLQIIQTYTETLRTYVEDDGEDYVAKILEAARDAVEITTTARDVTEVMRQTETETRPISVHLVLENEIEDVRSNHEDALIRVDGSIPTAPVRADDMLESVFRNLLTNAIQHNDKEVPEVTVSAERIDGAVLVQIADNGPGIPEDRRQKIFNKDEVGLDSEGTGFGLYLVQTLVDRYDGDVRVEDNEPEGSVFTVELPVDTQ